MSSLERLLSEALARHQNGDLAQAEALYRRVLRRQPGHPEALHRLGLMASEFGDHDLAAVLIRKALGRAGPHPIYCGNLGVALQRQGKRRAAVCCFRQALDLDPGNAGHWSRLAAALVEDGQYEEACRAFASASRLAREDQAALIEFGWGNALALQALRQEAREHYRHAVQLQPSFTDAWFNLGVVCMQLNEIDGARDAYRRVLALHPHHAAAANNLGILEQAFGRLEQAMEYYRAALNIDPGYQDARYNLAVALQQADRCEEALAAYGQVLATNPQHAEALTNAGNTLLALNRVEEAIASYRAALVVAPGNPLARWNLAIAQLTAGDFANGWPGYEWRFRQPGAAPPRYPEARRWSGQAIAGQRLLVWAEQGLGDTLQFARFAPLAGKHGAQVILECQASLVPVLESLTGIAKLGPPAALAETPYDWHLPLLSLPGVLQVTAENASGEPYLRAPRVRAAQWAARLAQLCPEGHRRVGLAWAGNPRHSNDRNRSIPGRELSALQGVANTCFLSLQKGPASEPAAFPAHPPMQRLGPHLQDFGDTAAVIENLDLVISVDTAVAHLAGALGKPVWTLLPFAADWRWMRDRTDTPWYPSMRLFRQPAPKDWQSVLQSVRAELSR